MHRQSELVSLLLTDHLIKMYPSIVYTQYPPFGWCSFW